MQLFLLRHAEAEPDAANDQTRTLTAKGSKQAVSIGKFCFEHGFVPDMILTSPLKRAEETAQLFARELNLPTPVQIQEFLRPGMTPERAFSGLRESSINLMKREREKSSGKAIIMLVGHEPDFSTLAGALIGGRAESVHFRKATLMSLTLEEFKPGAGTIEFLIPVKCL